MAVPGSGAISLGRIRQELQTANYAGGAYTAAATGLDPAENGTYATINTCSPSYPLSANPAKMSEWYGYDHDAPCRYALDTGGSANANMLYRSQDDWGQVISTGNPNQQGEWTVNFWIKHVPESSDYQGYIWNLAYNDQAYPGLAFTWNTGFNSNTGLYESAIQMSFYGGANSGSVSAVFSQAMLTDDDNILVTEISNDSLWNSENTGTTNSNGYTLITVSYNYNNYQTDDWVKWYWNGNALTVPYQAASSDRSYITGSNGAPSNTNWGDGGTLLIGGVYPYEISSGLYIDEWSFDPFSDNGSNASALWNSGVPDSTTNLNSTFGTDYLHYDFETTSSLGAEAAGHYDYDLADYNSPTYTTDAAN